MIVFDIETAALESAPDPDPGEPPSNYTKIRNDPVKLAEWKAKKAEDMRRKYALAPTTGRVAMIAAWCNEDHDGDVEVFYDPDEAKMLQAFGDYVESCDIIDSIQTRHALVAYNGLRFDFNFMGVRAMARGQWGMARRMFPARKYGDPWHIDPYNIFDGGSSSSAPKGSSTLGAAAAVLGHHHRSQSGGSMVGEWLEQGNIAAVRQHIIDDIEALVVVTDALLKAGAIQPAR